MGNQANCPMRSEKKAQANQQIDKGEDDNPTPANSNRMNKDDKFVNDIGMYASYISEDADPQGFMTQQDNSS
ncbi:hypothetical protein E2562_000679 [Oryza meyeriana var. granulata]|uniref:Uncharacterized protein n=1 Tax=Oryza meyeriana var. granulata TaxID=110450 RepID=A0A6G1DUH2_9ORYZ|nr:hypothetical protein E2562_000679 [Oryza meyeriana var. granulata]